MANEPTVPLLEHLHANMGALRRSERKVAALIIEDPAFVVNSTMAAVAEAAGVSEPTVMRFCTSMGFNGFQQFRMGLAQTVALGIPAMLSTIQKQDSPADIATKVFDHTISSLDRARKYLDVDQVDRAVQAILAASSMTLVGLGASSIIAVDAEQKAPLFGIPCSAPMDVHQQFMAASMAQPGTVMVAISNTGRTQSVIRVARTARLNGAVVIGITGERSPLLSECDIPIILKTFEDTDIFTPIVSRMAGLAIIDVLATTVALKRGSHHLERLAKMKEGLSDFRGRDDRVPGP